VTGLSSQQASEHFQHSNEAIVKYFTSPPFYTLQVQFPMASTPIAAAIEDSPHFQFFCDCIGAVDSTHIHPFVCQEDHPSM
ncbi:hypothetical protein SCLCIDRAFT_97091, partial [Scleroderma citrinum Foug A]